MRFKTCFLLASFLFHQLGVASIEDLDPYIEKARLQTQVPGVAVSVVEGNKILLAKGYGLCQIGRIEKVDAETIFQLASVSKTFASAGLGIQVDLGKLSWDEEVIRHLPEFALKDAYASRFATARDLLAHRTGLPAFGGDLLGKLGYPESEILYRIRFIEPATSFRNKALYSNIGFFAAGELLAKLAGQSWDATIQETLLKPLKMNRSGFYANLKNSNVAAAHAQINAKIQVIPWVWTGDFPSAGGVTSTANDMAQWMILHLNEGRFEGKQLIKPETIKEIHHASIPAEISFAELPPIDETTGFYYGLGWDSYYYRGQWIVEKGGALDGMRSVVTLIPGLKVGITVLANLNLTVLPELIRARFLEDYLGKGDRDLAKEILERGQSLADLLKEPPKNPKALPMGYPLAKYLGDFANELYGVFTIREEAGQLHVNTGPGGWQGQLVHEGNNTFAVRWPSVNLKNEFTFIFGPEGEVTAFESEALGTFLRKVKPK